MSAIKNINIDGMEFQLNKLKALKALKLEKKIMAVASPVISSTMNTGDLDKELDFSVVGKAFATALESLDEDEYEKLLLDAVSNVTFLGDKQAPQLITKSVFDIIFVGNLLTVYKLIYEIMKFNKFCFFEMVGNGKLTEIISTTKESVKPVKNTKTN